MPQETPEPRRSVLYAHFTLRQPAEHNGAGPEDYNTLEGVTALDTTYLTVREAGVVMGERLARILDVLLDEKDKRVAEYNAAHPLPEVPAEEEDEGQKEVDLQA